MPPKENSTSRLRFWKRWSFLPPLSPKMPTTASSKTQHGRHRWSCGITACFGGHILASDSGGSGQPELLGRAASSSSDKPKTTTAAWLSWSTLWKKRKTVPVDSPVSAKESPPKKFWKGRTSKRSSSAQEQRRASAPPSVHVSRELSQPRLPQISTNIRYNARGEPATVRPQSRMSRSGPPQLPDLPLDPVRSGTVDPDVGIRLMVAALAVMVFFGRASAIVCLCSLLYLWPLRRSPEAASSGGWMAFKETDTGSDEYKKRAILEGLLERNGRKGLLVAAKVPGATR